MYSTVKAVIDLTDTEGDEYYTEDDYTAAGALRIKLGVEGCVVREGGYPALSLPFSLSLSLSLCSHLTSSLPPSCRCPREGLAPAPAAPN